MINFLSRRARRGAGGTLVLAAAFLISCGGGVVGSGGTGSAPPGGVSIGTVNGFGSVIVDGVAYDDQHAPVLAETAPGIDSPAEVRLGERVAVGYTQAGVASEIRIMTALSGQVATAPSNGSFTILGQTVVVNTAAGSGPTTQFGGGYMRASDIVVGDAIDVNGVLVQKGATWVLSATRIDKLAAPPAYLRVTNVVSGLAPGGTFFLGNLAVDASAAVLLPDDTMLADGQAVTVLALPSTYVASGTNAPRLQAAQVRVATLQESSIDDYLSGSVSSIDTVAKTFTLGAQRVSYAGAVITPAGAMPSNGDYVQVQGKVGSDGTLVASNVSIRSGESEDESELSGTIVAFDSVVNSFMVRDVLVDASTATLENCPAGGLANGIYVHVAGTLASDGVVASTIQCTSEPSGGTIERQGRASAIDTVAQTFTLTSQEGAVVAVQWTSTTFFGNGLTPTTLSGMTVNVQGAFAGNVLMATKVKLDD